MVIVNMLGDGCEYRAEVVGIGVDHQPEVGSIMIIRMIDRFRDSEDYQFDYCCVPETCLRRFN